ncbi:nucleotide disphospho-sugar-binding domain-containing protein [Serinicoccus sp. LYQ131]|uniref:nucleotide disphospho-sugar-binding domain-containing protein n=1 Tax=Serinicoccus sp. LYQ131 TaxID=3378797 RepID=UPI00385489D1
MRDGRTSGVRPGARRVLLVAVGTRGDVEPAARLAQALLAQGMAVAVAVLADGAERVRAAGAVPVVVGPASGAAMWWASPTAQSAARAVPALSYLQLRERLSAGAARVVGTLAPWLRTSDVVLVGLALARLVPVLDRAGIPARLVLHAPLLPHPAGTSTWAHPVTAHLPHQLEDARQQLMWWLTTQLSAAAARALSHELGLAPVTARDRRRPERTAYPPLMSTSPVLDPEPAPGPVQTGFWGDLHPVRQLPAVLHRWLDRHPGALLLTQGSMPRTAPEQQVARLLAAARAVGRPALLQVNGATAGPRRGGLVIGEVDHRSLLERVDAILHHGGAGTTHVATAAGVPQLVAPELGDQWHWGRRVEALGLGRSVAARAGTARVARRLDETLAAGPRAAASAAAVAERSRGQDGLRVAVAEVEAMDR